MKNKVSIFILIFSLYVSAFADDGVLFRFDQKAGSSASHISTIYEEAYFNEEMISVAEVVTRMTTTVLEELDDNTARLQGKYMTTNTVQEGNNSNVLTWNDDEIITNITRKSNGILYDSDNDVMPNIRAIPSFPNSKMRVGDSWKMRGEEIFDCRDLFGMDQLIKVPFTAIYTYTKDETIDGKLLRVIDVSYELQQYNFGNSLYKTGTFANIYEYAQQRIYWDSEINDLYSYTEEVVVQMVDSFNNVYKISSSANGEVTAYKSVNNDEQIQKIQETVDNFELEDVSVSKGEKGVTISIENIQFQPDSDILLDSEKEKLLKIGELLKSFPNDLLITGHCAKRGTEESQQSLSETRAQSVANFLIENNVRDKYRIFTQGKGAREPIASNDTEEGRIKNRRVEITIMD